MNPPVDEAMRELGVQLPIGRIVRVQCSVSGSAIRALAEEPSEKSDRDEQSADERKEH
jgi:hypothetical protein